MQLIAGFSMHHLELVFGIKKDEADINSLMSVLTETFINPLSDNPILCLSNRMVASDEVSNDLLKAKEKGRVAMKKFIDERLSATAVDSLYDPIKKLHENVFGYEESGYYELK